MTKTKAMKKTLLVLLVLLTTSILTVNAQESFKTPGKKEFKEWSEWKKMTYNVSDAVSVELEYRLAMSGRKGIACHYDMEIKNLSDKKIEGQIIWRYYDNLVKSNIKEVKDYKLKPNGTAAVHLIVQGCKKKDKELEDYDVCLACPCSFDLNVNKVK